MHFLNLWKWYCLFWDQCQGMASLSPRNTERTVPQVCSYQVWAGRKSYAGFNNLVLDC